jgi:uncharacterized membrane protein YeaQ/YmgE (transglycosylase-associated protein family)
MDVAGHEPKERSVLKNLVLEFGQPLATLIVGILGAVMTRFVLAKIKSDTARRLIERVYSEVVDAVLVVWQTYVAELKENAADGKLTYAEKREAKQRAVTSVIEQLGEKGMKGLATALGFSKAGVVSEVDKTVAWLEHKTESAVAGLKSAGALMNGVRKGTIVQAAPLGPS